MTGIILPVILGAGDHHCGCFFLLLPLQMTVSTAAVVHEEGDTHDDEEGEEAVDDVDGDPGRAGEVTPELTSVHTFDVKIL